MKLLYCIPSLYNAGGMERVLTEKANYLVNLSNYDITIVTTDQKNLPLRFPLDLKVSLVHLNIDFDSHFKAGLIKKYISHKKKIKLYQNQLIELLKKQEIDICISMCGKEIEFLASVPVKCKKVAEMHFAMNVREQFINARHKGLFWKLLGQLRTRQLLYTTKKLSKLVVLTDADKRHWDKTHKNCIAIPNANPLKNATISNCTNKKVITIGKLDAQKGYDMLLDAWRLVVLQHPDWILNIFGIGEWHQMLLEKIKEFKLEHHVYLCGSTKDVAEKYLESSIYVMSSRYEGFGMVLIEAMSCGLPAISFDCEQGPGEIIIDGQNGFLVEPNNIQQLASKICVLIKNENTRKAMGTNAAKSVERFEVEPIMQKWINLLSDIYENTHY